MDLEEQVDNDSCDPDENHVQSGDGDGLTTAKWTNLKKKAFGFSSHISSAFKRCSLGILRRQHQYGMIQPSSHRSFTLDILRVGRSVILSSYINFLLVFVPIGFATYTAKVPSPWIFATNAIAIVPLSALLTDATERIASEAGDTIGSLLNISLGNAVELILFVALKEGHTRIVEASVLGSVLVNILLILGSALMTSSYVDSTLTYAVSATQLLGSLLFVCVFAFLMPTAYSFAFPPKDDGNALLWMSRTTACLVLLVYIGYLIHELRTAPSARSAEFKEETPILDSRQPGSTSPLALPPRTIRFAEEDVIDGAQHRPVREYASLDSPRFSYESVGDQPFEPRGRPTSAFTRFPSFVSRSASRPRVHSRSVSLGSLRSQISCASSGIPRGRIPTTRAVRSFDEPRVDFEEIMTVSTAANRTVASLVLVVSALLMSLNAEFLVSTIDEITHHGEMHFSESFIGLIILPIVGNVAEYITVVTVALRGKLDLAVAVSIGSSVQIALCVAPLTVIAAWVMKVDLTLTFNVFEMASLFGTVLLVKIVVLGEGAGEHANTLRGGLVCACYGIIAVGAYLAPE